MIALTKIDIQPWDTLDEPTKERLQTLAKDNGAFLLHMSNLSEEGISDIKKTACEILLDHRLTQKAKDPKKAESVLNRVHVSVPKASGGEVKPIIPESVKKGIARPEGQKTAREL